MVFWTENRPQNIDILTLARLANFNLDSFPKKKTYFNGRLPFWHILNILTQCGQQRRLWLYLFTTSSFKLDR